MPAPSRRGLLVAERAVTAVQVPHSVSFACRSFSVLNRPPPNYPGHVPLTCIERGALAVGSALGSLLNPRRGGWFELHPFYEAIAEAMD